MEATNTRTQWEEDCGFYCIQSDAAILDHNWKFTIVCHSKHLIVSASRALLPEEPMTTLLPRLSKLMGEDDPYEFEAVENEVLDVFFEAGWKQFMAVAPSLSQEEKMKMKRLDKDLNPETFYFRLITKEGQFAIEQIPPPQPQPNTFSLKLNDTTPELPQYQSRDVTMMTKLMSAGYIAQVSIDGLQMCCKVGTRHSFKAVQREYDCLLQVSISKFAEFIPAPKLLGLIVGDNEVVIGILEEFIPNTGNLGDVVKNDAEISEERREKWKRQITEAVEKLHEIDVVWGDGKPQNVLVGESDDLVLVDFGGSWTDGWVDEELRETKEGDLQALDRISKFLDDGGSALK